MGYPYSGSGLRTRIDLPRQVYQKCGTESHLSGSTIIDQGLQVMLSGMCANISATTYGFTVTATTGNTVVISMGQDADTTIGKSGLQINPNLLVSSTGIDLELNMSTGEVYTFSSSIRYKKDVENLEYNDYKNVLNLTPVKFKWKSTNEESVGFIAEEAHKLGLNKFVVYNTNGEIEGLNYKLLTVALIGILKNGVSPKLITEKISESIDDTPIIITEDYTTNSTRYIIAKKDLTITLNDSELKRFYIKSMSNISVIPSKGLIDEDWEEISMGPQSSVELISHEGGWYVLSSDGLKNS